MKIFSVQQIREWDTFTIEHEPISSIDLMERAAEKCFLWLQQNIPPALHFIIFCGPGNNGGDGLAIAEKLKQITSNIDVFILAGEKRSNDFIINLERLAAENINLSFLFQKETLPEIKRDDIIIDALFGSGLNKPLEGLAVEIVKHINQSSAMVISIDIPSGLFADTTSQHNTIIKTTHTLSFQVSKLAFFMPENEVYIGEVHLLDIGLQKKYYEDTTPLFYTIDEEIVERIYKPRKKFSYKYNFGHALLYTGSKNMMGAAILSTKACLRSGAGLATVRTNNDTQAIIYTSLPEAITTTENDPEKIWQKKNVIAIGPGLEDSDQNRELLKKVIMHFKGALVIDATALKLLSSFLELLLHRQQHPAILTPHTGEFEKLFGKTDNDFERIELALHKAVTLNCYIILKGRYTFIATPFGKGFFNTTGNPGMATAGSGDVLTGIIAGLLAQGYTEQDACIFAVYLHGLAGDLASAKVSEEAMIAGDIIESMGEAFKHVINKKHLV